MSRPLGRLGRHRIIAWVLAATCVAALAGLAAPAFAAPTGVTNSSLEAVTAGVPTCFEQSGWGTNTTTWALTAAAHTGSVAQSLTISGYVSGDQKLLMAENTTCAPAVTPAHTYALTVWYTATGTANALTVFRHSAAGWTYWTDLASFPAAGGWTAATATTPPVPAGTDQITFGMSLAGNGTLVTDDYSMADTTAGTPTPSPTSTGTNPQLSYDPGLENAGNPPDGWLLSGWGDAVVTSGVTADAHSGTRAFSVTLAGRTQGDYKLLPTDAQAPAVQPGNTYLLSVWYKSTSTANAITVFAHTSSGWAYLTDLITMPATTTYKQASVTTPPIGAGIDAIAWGVSIAANGTLETDDYSTTLASGATTPPTSTPATQGAWTVLAQQMPIRAMHTTLLDNGKVLLVAGSGNDVNQFAAGTFRAAVWDPISNTFQTLTVPTDMFCSGHVTLPDGRVLIQGGTKAYPTSVGANYAGLKNTYIFDPSTNLFTRMGDANEGHWYPTLTELGDGSIWMAGGLKEDTTGAVNTERWSTTTNSWLTTAQVPQTYSYWGLYPHMFLLADGRLFYSGGHVFGNGLPGTGASLYNWTAATITDVPGLRSKDLRDQSASVLLPPAQSQRVMITGGGNINTNTPGINQTDLIDLTQANPTYVPGPDLPGMGKMYLNATILPDRTVLVTNGAQLNRDAASDVFTAAVYDPVANAWTSVAADPIGRNYHSTAILLPDGRVAVLGSNPGDGSFEMRISMYQPTYLFKTARPVISGTPATATYGQTFTFNVKPSGSATVKWAQFMRPMSVTHQMDTNMRLVDLPLIVSGGLATVTVPTNDNLLPPGPYMLNVTDSLGIPSTSQWVMVH